MSPSSIYVSLMLVLGALAALGAHIGLLVYAIRKPSDGSRARKFAIIGLSMLIASMSANWPIQLLIGQSVEVNYYFLVQFVANLGLGGVRIMGIGFLVVAVFSGRSTEPVSMEIGNLDRGSTVPETGNPYAAPRDQASVVPKYWPLRFVSISPQI